jgi:serine protease
MKRYPARLSILAAAVALATPLAQACASTNIARSMPTGPRDRARIDRFIVTYRAGSAESVHRHALLQNVSAAVSRAGLDRPAADGPAARIAPLSARYVRKLAVGSDLIGVSRALDDVQARNLMQMIAADPAVLHVEPDIRLRPLRESRGSSGVTARVVPPNDPLYATHQWHYRDPHGGANIDKAWELADGNDVTVAVLDTGITRHPDLDTSLADAGYDFISDAFLSGRDRDGRASGGWDPGDWTDGAYGLCEGEDIAEPSSWHGTHVAGTVAALTDNGIGGAGVAYKARVLPVRVLGHCGGNFSDIVDAVVWAAGGHVDGVPDNEHPAQVINMSLGAVTRHGCEDTPSMRSAIAEANRRGTAVVVAAGNLDIEVASSVPASCPGAIAIAANDIGGRRASYSNHGELIALAAPGGGGSADGETNGFVWSTLNDGLTTPGQPTYGGYARTSVAAPHVAGVAALVIGAVKQAGLPALSAERIRKLLVDTARPFPVVPDKKIGAGIVDAEAAVTKALAKVEEEPVIRLVRGKLLPNQAIEQERSLLYAIEVPSSARHLNQRILGGAGDATLYVKTGKPPATDGGDADAVSDKPGNSEAIVLPLPAAGTWYLRVHAKEAVSKLTVFGNYAL